MNSYEHEYTVTLRNGVAYVYADRDGYDRVQDQYVFYRGTESVARFEKADVVKITRDDDE
jgi:hypothetical protein